MKKDNLPTTSLLYKDACIIIDQAKIHAYKAINNTLIKRNWLLGMRIQHEVLKEKRAEYGEQVIKSLAKELTTQYGEGYSRNNLYRFVSFYKSYSTLFQAAIGKSGIVPSVMGQSEIVPSLTGLSEDVDIYNLLEPTNPIRLSWTHYSILLQEYNTEARTWYENESVNEMWSTRTLQRNVSSQYYHRLLQSQKKELVRNEMHKLTAPLQDKLEFLKNPFIAEFLGLKNNPDFSESTLEKSIINHLIPFLMELGKGFAFVDRQKHIHTEKQDYYIDLVFYNYHLRCFVLIDLKTTKLSYQDVGQMDMYIRMYDDLKKKNDDNPTIGIVLCTKTDEDIARYSVLHDSKQIFMAKYMPYMPTKEELKLEIEKEKANFYLQHPELAEGEN